MSLQCSDCGVKATYADASIADALRTCDSTRVVQHTAVGPVHDGSKHDWEEL